jgi:uncharacterized protein YdcH (DUF465 family)
MGHTPHELHEEFPAARSALSALKADPHFSKLADAYHELNRTVHRMETDVEAVADHVLEEAKKKRLELKDQIAALLDRAG